jgi:nucleoside-diphosphate-sugar epimerase
MTILVVGASGATGKLLIEQLLVGLEVSEKVRIIVRSVDTLPDKIKQSEQVIITEASLLEMSDAELKTQVQGCRAVVSCLGHNLSFNGMFGHPRRLVTDAVQRLCKSIEAQAHPPKTSVKFILMNTTGNQNLQADEKISISHALVISLIRLLLPPHADNESAARYLQSYFGNNHYGLEWVVVRPDSLTNETSVSEYKNYESPIRSAIFNSGKTSRINVAHFIAQLIDNSDIWNKWKSKMPVIYNTSI